MTHEELSQLYEIYVMGVLEGEEKIELEQHLAQGCPLCVSGVQNARRFTAMFAGLPALEEPPRNLRTRILAGVGVEPRTQRVWLGLLGAVSASLLVAVVVLSMKVVSERARLDEVLAYLNQPQTRQLVSNHGRIFVNENGVALVGIALPPPPRGKIYEMWLVPKAGAPIPAGLFHSNEQGNALYLRNSPVDLNATKAIAVSLEPEAGSLTPTTIVFAAPL